MLVTQYFAKDIYKGKTVFVTGGGSGINLGVAKNFAALGANIGICGRTQQKLDDAAQELRALGAQVCPVAADVRDITALQAAFARCKAECGPIDVLVCGAAGNFVVPAEKLSANGFKTVIDIDLIGSFNASSAAFEQLKETRGTILYLSAGMAYVPHAYQAHVGAAKAGIDMLMKNLALEWGRYGIRTNSIVPGPIEGTEGMKRLSTAATRATLLESVPLRRVGSVDDVGQTAVFLASPLASFISGCVVVCDGGANLAGSGRFNAGAEGVLREQGKL
ncbi:MAG TPA: SDR family oxidoreductase [Steroidobacteraceae bacterium]|jgi:NAD(P)-dependent dehydrogenase (short-subunit alcohol dehydrogenase family)